MGKPFSVHGAEDLLAVVGRVGDLATALLEVADLRGEIADQADASDALIDRFDGAINRLEAALDDMAYSACYRPNVERGLYGIPDDTLAIFRKAAAVGMEADRRFAARSTFEEPDGPRDTAAPPPEDPPKGGE